MQCLCHAVLIDGRYRTALKIWVRSTPWPINPEVPLQAGVSKGKSATCGLKGLPGVGVSQTNYQRAGNLP